ncbi:MAG: hypothetical protein HYS86_01515 [Candidatus Chisholmbacteria bacterium]|nr:hypothetical protein [Candidatus Chisholmbacteria bacterium]
MVKRTSKKKRQKQLEWDTRFKWGIGLLLLGLVFIVGSNFPRLSLRSPWLSLTQRLERVEEISAQELKERMEDKDFALINVHVPYEGEIERTDNFIEYDSMVARAKLLPKDKNAAIVLYCQTGRMSEEAGRTLKQMGYTNVVHLKGGMEAWERAGGEILDLSSLTNEVLPKEGFEFPISWGEMGPRLIEIGVIDLDEFEEATKLTSEERDILTKGSTEKIKINSDNSHFMVNLLWALGLAQKSLAYSEGPMGAEYKDEAGNFASTGGWTLGRAEATTYLGRYDLVPLTSEQQEKVKEIAENVYRPCCGNSTFFPDCNHGMAALGAIEMVAAAGMSEEEIFKNILALNSFWFPDTYLSVATYFERQGTQWADVDAKMALGPDYSSAQGAANIYQKVGSLPYSGAQGGSCGA